ncbi:MerR family transcriptional regulator [Chitinophaga pinensis]|uniref:MerR family transcriptional regulator n=1 Tax=Chitinophaga pinensis TaxID=79329 RepID=A0A5C6LNT0_9BACT|nr:MerR family transcriptional regulator [Chitinophaga pinensis]
MASENYSIKDLERLSGIKAHTLRIWENAMVSSNRAERILISVTTVTTNLKRS